MTSEQIQKNNEALLRALNGSSKNDVVAIVAFKEREFEDIRPRENIFTFAAWKACGRSVLKGQKAVHVPIVKMSRKEDPETGEEIVRRYPSTAYIFHVSQTQEDPEWDKETAVPEALAVREGLGLS